MSINVRWMRDEMPPLPVISAWYLDGRDVEEMEYTFGVGDFCMCHEINQYARALPKIRKNNLNIWYVIFRLWPWLRSSDLCEGPHLLRWGLRPNEKKRREEERKEKNKNLISTLNKFLQCRIVMFKKGNVLESVMSDNSISYRQLDSTVFTLAIVESARSLVRYARHR